MGLTEPPPATEEPAEGEWVDLRPRWPLTEEKDPRCAPVLKSTRKKKIHDALYAPSITEGEAGEQEAQEGVGAATS